MTEPANDLPPWLEPALRRGLAMPAHALLLHAPGPLGQLELALALARSALCESPAAEGRACGRCAACHLFARRTHADVRVLVPEAIALRLGWVTTAEEGGDGSGAKSKAKPSRDIKVDAVRSAIDWSHQTSARGRAKVLVIHPAEAMNETAANALLKTLEEPPGRLRLLLTASDPDALLPTVRSRCQRLPIAPPAPAQAVAWLEAAGVAQAGRLLAAAGGLPHAALALHEDGIEAETWSRIPAWVHSGQGAGLASWPVARVVEALHKLCHDLMRLVAGGEGRYFDAPALAAAARPGLPAMNELAAWERELLRAARHDEHPWHAPLRIEALVAQAAALWQTARGEQAARGRPLDTLPGR